MSIWVGLKPYSWCPQVQNDSPGIVANAGVWGTHMGVSSNVRYQLLNGLDMVGSVNCNMHYCYLKRHSSKLQRTCRIVSWLTALHKCLCRPVQLLHTQVLAPAIPPSAFKALSTIIRLLNNIVGGMSFVTLAKIFGVQKSSED